jgi:hypothetical protein
MHDWPCLLQALRLLVGRLQAEVNPQPEFPYRIRELLMRYFRGCADVWVRDQLITATHNRELPSPVRQSAGAILGQIQSRDPYDWNLVCEEELLDLHTEYVTAYRIAHYLAVRVAQDAPVAEIRNTLQAVLECLDGEVPAEGYYVHHHWAGVFRWTGGGGGPGSQQRLQAFFFACGGRVVGQPGPPLAQFRDFICATVDQLLADPGYQELHPSLTALRDAFM